MMSDKTKVTSSGPKRALPSDDTALSDTPSRNFERRGLATKVFNINDLLLHILGFLVGTNLDQLMEKRDIRVTSIQFNECFKKLLHSLPLIHYEINYDNSHSRDTIAAVQWMKRNHVSPHKIDIYIPDTYLNKIYQCFLRLDFKCLNKLRIRIDLDYEGNIEDIGREEFYSLFKNASLLQGLSIHDKDLRLGIDYLSYFPALMFLEVQSSYSPSQIINADFNFAKELTLIDWEENLVLKSRKLKLLNVIYPFPIDRVDCPFLEKFVCVVDIDFYNVTIGGIDPLIIKEKYQQEVDEDFIAEHLPEKPLGMELNADYGVAIVPHSFLKEHSFNFADDCLVIFFFSNIFKD